MRHRPELLWEIVKRVALELGQAPELGNLLQQGVNAVQGDALSIFQSEYDPLTELQQAILFVLSQAAAENRPFTPFTQATLKEIQARAGRKTQPAPPPAWTHCVKRSWCGAQAAGCMLWKIAVWENGYCLTIAEQVKALSSEGHF